MRTNGYQNYFDDEVLTADPLEARATALPWSAGFDRPRRAAICGLGDIRARSRAISKAMAIVTELSQSL